MELNTPPGYKPVEHTDGLVHAISMAAWNASSGIPLYMATPVCGTETTVPEGLGVEAMYRPAITCPACITELTSP